MRVSLVAVPALLLFCMPILGAIQPAQADVVYTEVIRGPASSRGANRMVMSQVYVNDKAMRREAQPAHDSGPPGDLIPSSGQGSINAMLEVMQLDRGILWMRNASGRVEKHLLSNRPNPAPKARLSRMADLADIQVLSSQAVLKRTGFKTNINGYMCDHIFAIVTCDARDRSTGDKGTLVLMNDLWMADDVAGTDEIREFRRSLGDIYGLREYFCPDAALFAQAIPEQARQLGKMMYDVDGLPVSSTMTAKFKKNVHGKMETDLLYSLTTDMLDIEPLAYNPNIYEVPK